MKNRSARGKRSQAGIRSSLIFIVCLASFAFLLVWMLQNRSAVACLQTAVARLTSLVLNLFGNRTQVVGHTVVSSRFNVEVITACTGLYTVTVFLSAVIAYPSRFLAKLIGVGYCIVGISLLNVIRLASLFYIGVYFPGFLERAHLVIWQSLIIVFSLFLWLLWAEKVAHASYKR